MEDLFKKTRKKLEEELDDKMEVDEDSDLPIHEKYTKQKKKLDS